MCDPSDPGPRGWPGAGRRPFPSSGASASPQPEDASGPRLRPSVAPTARPSVAGLTNCLCWSSRRGVVSGRCSKPALAGTLSTPLLHSHRELAEPITEAKKTETGARRTEGARRRCETCAGPLGRREARGFDQPSRQRCLHGLTVLRRRQPVVVHRVVKPMTSLTEGPVRAISAPGRKPLIDLTGAAHLMVRGVLCLRLRAGRLRRSFSAAVSGGCAARVATTPEKTRGTFGARIGPQCCIDLWKQDSRPSQSGNRGGGGYEIRTREDSEPSKSPNSLDYASLTTCFRSTSRRHVESPSGAR